MKRIATRQRWLGVVAGMGMWALGITSVVAGTPEHTRTHEDGATAAAPVCANTPANSVLGHGFLYCGYHWQTWPVTYTVDAPAGSAGITHAQLRAAVDSAARAWNDAWRLIEPASNKVPFVYSPASVNHVRFGSAPGAVARTTFDNSGFLLTRATVTLNVTQRWTTAAHAWGELPALLGACPEGLLTCDTFDVQEVVTHELGHVLGLEHPGDQDGIWSDDVDEAVDAQQTMYWYGWPEATNKRSLEWGDVLGVRAVGASMGLTLRPPAT